MFEFLYQNLATILISLALLALFILALVHIFKSKGGCGCSGCSGCSGNCSCCSGHAEQIHAGKSIDRQCCKAHSK